MNTTYSTKQYEPFQQLLQRMEPHSTLLRAWPLQGGVSAEVTALEVRNPDGSTKKLVVRQHSFADYTSNPQIATNEFRLLQYLHTAKLATPQPYYLDQSCALFATPVLIIEYIDSTHAFTAVPNSDHIRQFATHLSRIHALDCTAFDLSFLPNQIDSIAKQLHKRPTADEWQLWDTLQSVWPIIANWQNPATLLHGDYWPGNTLWNDGQLVAIIDWEDAAIGNPLADLANSRLELLWSAGSAAMELFTQHYQLLTHIDLSTLPYWDLCAAMRPAQKMAEWGLDVQTEQTMREGLHMFIRQASANISVETPRRGV
jgi:aminoglycoside phosphotransferase (APT) family kinase protein